MAGFDRAEHPLDRFLVPIDPAPVALDERGDGHGLRCTEREIEPPASGGNPPGRKTPVEEIEKRLGRDGLAFETEEPRSPTPPAARRSAGPRLALRPEEIVAKPFRSAQERGAQHRVVSAAGRDPRSRRSISARASS